MSCNCKQQPQLPSVATMATKATQAAGRVLYAAISGSGVKVSPQESERRLAICKFCTESVQYKDTEYLRCSKCGCWLNGKRFAKAYLSTEDCPLGKWGSND